MKCFYHSADLDGKCSGAIVKLKHPDCELIGINYGDAFPWDSVSPGEVVYMVDFSLQPFSEMILLNNLVDLVWIDHHESAINERNKHPLVDFHGKQENGRAGCELTWDWCFGPKIIPRAVYLLGRYDVWDMSNHPAAWEFQYGIRQFECDPNDSEFWRDLFFGLDMAGDVQAAGKMLLEYEKRNNFVYANAYSFDTEINGVKCVAVNRGCCNSTLFDSVYDPTRHDAMLSFCRAKRGGWKISIYSDKIDVSVIAKGFGGGGHKGAAGFHLEQLPF